MILLTGASGTVGSALLRRLTTSAEPVRCLVRDPRRLGDDRVRVQIALGDLADPPSFSERAARRAHRHPPRGVDSRPAARVDRGAERRCHASPGPRCRARRGGRFVFFSAMGAEHLSRTRFLRAKALAERGRPGLRPGDDGVRAVDRLLARRPLADPARALLATCRRYRCPAPGGALPADLGRGRGRLRDRGARRATARTAGASSSPAPRPSPTTDLVARGPRGERPPAQAAARAPAVVRTSLRALGRSAGPVFATWDEAELIEEPMTTARGTADAESSACARSRWPPC